jgi:hypothetical protein
MSENQSQKGGEKEEKLANDLLHGCKAIADFIGRPERATYHDIEAGNLQVTRIGRKIVGSKTALRRQLVPGA